MNDALPQGDVQPRVFPPLYLVQAKPLIRRAQESDKPFMLSLAHEKYRQRVVEKSIQWVEWCMTCPERLVLVGPNSFGIAQASLRYGGSEWDARLALLCARTPPNAGLGAGLEVLYMVETMLDWARAKGCTGNFKIDADTGVDFSPLATRLGGRVVTVKRCEVAL